MSVNWVINEDLLSIKLDNNSIYVPSALEIFSSVNKNSHNLIPIINNLPSPTEVYPDLIFSRFGSRILVELCLLDNQKVRISLYLMRNGERSELSLINGVLPDHLIVKNTWIYFNQNYEEIVSWLSNSGITDLESIELNKYFSLLGNAHKYLDIKIQDFVIEKVREANEGFIKQSPPIGLNANLYPYQTKGYRWLNFITAEKCGCILADEMGLGKTLQVIAVLLEHKYQGRGPSLVIAPVSLLENWRREIVKFAPQLSVVINHGIRRTGLYLDLLKYDVIVISYASAISDYSMLNMIQWNIVVLDEAQNIKNPNALRTQSVKRISRNSSIAVTGTPFENHILDIWSIADFVMPGYLGTQSQFEKEYTDDLLSADNLEPLISPLMLRRKVSDVAQDLPDRIDIPEAIMMDDSEANAYEKVRESIIVQLGEKNASLASLQILRMYCTHPFVYEKKHIGIMDPAVFSSKYQRCCEIINNIICNGEKVILFTTFNAMFDIFKQDIPSRFNIPVYQINGLTEVDERQKIIDKYSDFQGSALLVLNPRAAGVGLNITAANHVIHYNLEWNPAVEDQASARAYRKGQEKKVFIWRLFYADTVEEIVNDRVNRKRDISDRVILGVDGENKNIEDIINAIQRTPFRRGNYNGP